MTPADTAQFMIPFGGWLAVLLIRQTYLHIASQPAQIIRAKRRRRA